MECPVWKLWEVQQKKMYLLNTVISAYEVNNAIHIMQEADEHIIINVLRTQQFVGRFTGRPWNRAGYESL